MVKIITLILAMMFSVSVYAADMTVTKMKVEDLAQLYSVDEKLMTEAQVDNNVSKLKAQKQAYIASQVSVIDKELAKWQLVKSKITELKGQ